MTEDVAQFAILGEEIANVRVEIFNLAGVQVFAQEAVGSGVPTLNPNERLANGVYLVVVTVNKSNGEVIKSEMRRLIILR
ncbi:T9SS type A sorting domain-containing protein [Candidatus Acetothermia bacterium]|nr:T9SS type A sorting domain-containing protein [Candidatus Acetothermia bacterium]